MTEPALRAFVLSGPGAAAALDWLHVHADVRGVIEADDERVTVFVAAELPRLPFTDVLVSETVIDAAACNLTGLEDDRVVAVAEDLIVRPPWVERPPGFEGIDLVVPRGAAFGSGEHASTQAALLCLHALWNAPASLCDVGTGSGILAHYAAVRGCPAVSACDIDPAAVAAAGALLPGARIHLGGADQLAPADAVVANMTAVELGASLPAILALWNGRGPLVLSGMRADEVGAIRARLPATPDLRLERAPFHAVGIAGSRG
ncbi:MAG: 50S ribosomal protein L11 methyltransferase [Planctomycetes bacterium]|nr:50S ribosomal protein L11 methyltransferase [Planctomycetota bacterium]